MSCDDKIGIAVSIVCTVIGILVIPGVTVWVERTVDFGVKRESLIRLLEECQENIGKWLRSDTDDQWERGRHEIYELYLRLGQLKESLPVLGGGKAQSSELAGPASLIGRTQFPLLAMYMNGQGQGPTREQKAARSQEYQMLKETISVLKEEVNSAEQWEGYRAYINREIIAVYKSMWQVIAGGLRSVLKCKH